MNIVVCVKYVPDAQAERTFNASDNTTDRENVDGLLSELDEYAVEEALKIVEAGEGEVTVLTVGPDQAADAIKKSLQMGAGKGVHVNDAAIHGSDAVATSLVLAEAIRKIGADGQVDLVLTGMASTDGTMGVVPTMLAERLGLPAVTLASELTVEGGQATIRRDGDASTQTIQASLPALVSVTDQINEPRYPSSRASWRRRRSRCRRGASATWASTRRRWAWTPPGPRSSPSRPARRARRARSSPTTVTAATSSRPPSPSASSSDRPATRRRVTNHG
jgi:electron transfer flavoprotein beta subunit